MVLNPWNIDALSEVEKETGHKVNNILQLRLHESIKALKKRIDEGPKDKVYDVDLTYITSRGNWYYTSWKGDIRKSGGVATNIGVHFYDMLTWIFGPVKENIVHVKSHDRVAGFLGLEKARVRYFLSINGDNLPENAVQGENVLIVPFRSKEKNLSSVRDLPSCIRRVTDTFYPEKALVWTKYVTVSTLYIRFAMQNRSV